MTDEQKRKIIRDLNKALGNATEKSLGKDENKHMVRAIGHLEKARDIIAGREGSQKKTQKDQEPAQKKIEKTQKVQEETKEKEDEKEDIE